MTKKIKIYLIKVKKSYSYPEISKLLNTHIRTVQSWKKKGLQILEGSSHPYLIMGSDLKFFLMDRQNKRKVSLKEKEFYCLSCKKAVKAKSMQIQLNSKRIGKNKQSVTIKGFCEICGRKVNRFSSANIDEEQH